MSEAQHAPKAALDAYVARQAATVGRAPVAEDITTIGPVGPFKGATGAASLGIIDDFSESYLGKGPGSVTFAPDGRALYFGRDDGKLRRLALPTGTLVWEQSESEYGRGILCVAVSRDGKQIAYARKTGSVLIADTETGRTLREIKGSNAVFELSFSKDGQYLAMGGQRGARVVHLGTMAETELAPGHWSMTYSVAFAPEAPLLAEGASGGKLRLWNVPGGLFATHEHHRGDIHGVAWSPDGNRLVTGSEDKDVVICGLHPKDPILRLTGHTSLVFCVAWSPEGRRVASGSADRTIRIWDANTGLPLARYEFPEEFAYRLAFSPDGVLLASTHPCTARLWNTRTTVKAVAPAPRLLSAGPLAADLDPLPGALVALLRVNRSAPLSLLRDLLALTAGQASSPDTQRLSRHPGASALASLRWPPRARIALALLLLRDYEDTSFAPPNDISAAEIRFALIDALAGSASEPDAPPLPLAYLERALDAVDNRLLALLDSLGPEACADDPTLPLVMLGRLAQLAPRIALDRRLLALRVPAQSLGAAEARGPWLEPSGFSSSGHLLHLVPSQWALPDDLRHYRALDGGLLYRARFGREPPRLRPLVLVLDVSPTSFGPVEAMLRQAAHALAASLLDVGLPAYFIAAGGKNEARAIVHRTDLFELLTARAREPVHTGKTLTLAAELCASLPMHGPLEPTIVLLSHPSFGEEDLDVPAPKDLAGFFVHYPGHPREPAWQRRCKRAVCLGPDDEGLLAAALGQVLA
ncbi:WD40 repeat domain-containing protein [Polyangium jinanense]|uniref:WD40 repeat domain-containing protein n=1 Tax=Polyangium jinanense TaxID=2829994 RepID=A0A9X3X6U0_9BACT|nr:WD40 repeat domain-containing protein [Polyangium jinanense]MDC3957541.1 WD40 repeat domain-containing protein [Polyangium jinanense]MDC3984969.1 WD40 repeat domain-containing protein [Polyangium jinanense]